MAKSNRNPLVADMPGDTINNVHNVIVFLNWVETGGEARDCLSDEGACGRMLIYAAIDSAVQSLTPHLASSHEHAKRMDRQHGADSRDAQGVAHG